MVRDTMIYTRLFLIVLVVVELVSSSCPDEDTKLEMERVAGVDILWLTREGAGCRFQLAGEER
jgi:hypothetical protein